MKKHNFENFKKIIQYAIQVRHELHKYPEVAWKEYKTTSYIREILDQFEIEWKSLTKTGTVAYIAPNKKGKHIALRTDIDALEINEKNNLPYKSKHSNYSHACGHDGHTATLIATAIFLKLNESKLPGPVSIIFQPAEEGGHGAKVLIENDCLKNVDAIFGWHNWPTIEYGKALCPTGTVMAGNATFHVEVNGVGGHASQPEVCKDPVIAAAAITMSLQQVISRKTSPQSQSVLSVTSINAPSGLTTIPSKAKLHGSIRFSDIASKNEIKKSIFNIIESISNAYDVKSTIEFKGRYNPTINHKNETSLARQYLKEFLGDEWESSHSSPLMASEDFSYYLNKIPGAYFLIGADDGSPDYNNPCHSEKYVFNDQIIESTSKILIRLANFKGQIS